MIFKKLYNRKKKGKISGVYILRFPNNKIYVGSSVNINERFVSHIGRLIDRSHSPWYTLAATENNIIDKKGYDNLSWKEKRAYYDNIKIDIFYYPCANYREMEQKVLTSIQPDDRQYCYNTMF